jgi:hypothetical protein
MKPLQSSFQGEVFIDHRASPGLPEWVARLAGYDPEQCKEGKLFEGATLVCSHCLARVVKNVDRTRERAFCLACANHYICDMCDFERSQPGYIHKSFEAKRDEALNKEALQWQSVSSLVVPSHTQQSPLVLLPQAHQEWGSSAVAPLNTSTF